MKGKQSVKKGAWCIGVKRKYRGSQRGKRFPIGLLAFATAPFVGEIVKPLLKKIFGGRRRQCRKK